MGVKLNCKHVVLPSEVTWEGKFPLSEMDQLGVITHISVLYFYDRPNHEDWADPSKNKVINTLKESLSRALVPFYPLTGRLSWANGRRMELECNANSVNGAELIEAESSDKITDFGDFVDSSKAMFKDLLAPLDYVNTPIEQVPLLSVQVTRFACGGICLGIQISHMITDGRSAFHFLKEWAALARGEPVAVAPFLDHFAPTQIPKTVTTGLVDHSSAYVCETRKNDQDETSDPLSPTLVLLTADRIESLKKAVNQQEGTLARPYSRFEVIAAHLWRCRTRACESEYDQVLPLFVNGDVRSRLDPPLPPSYFGNAVMPGGTSCNAGDLISKPLSYACSKVREAINQLTNETIHGGIEWIRGADNISHFQYIQDRGDFVSDPLKNSSQPDIYVTSWLNLLAHGLDFGWGHEVFAGPPIGFGQESTVMVLPHNRSNGSVKLALWFKHEDMSSKFVDYMSSNDAK